MFGMTDAHWTTFLRRILFTGALGLVALVSVAGSAARAADDEEEKSIWNLDKRIFRSIATGLGLQGADDEDIQYRERSPLVLPPKRELPAPESVATEKNPAWPVDPDVKQRQEATAKRKTGGEYDRTNEYRNLMPSEIDRGRSAGSGKPAETDADGKVLKPSQLGYFGGLFSSGLGFGGPKEEVGTFRAEPPRTSLTAPPTGYQTPSAAAPYGVTKRLEPGKARKAEDIPVGVN
jgi:hypothetical protein